MSTGATSGLEPARVARVFRNDLAELEFPNVQGFGDAAVSLHPIQVTDRRRPPARYLVTDGDCRKGKPWVIDAITQVCVLLAMSAAARQERRWVEERFLREASLLLGDGDHAAASRWPVRCRAPSRPAPNIRRGRLVATDHDQTQR
ncbi:hypothetical protein [Mycolicibacterium sp. lyk4-40-TYG-92]|uniref:hypothetical protein n=1 Tax=Mycolicibacterium sp. lyk4-40-TYG-92 TaxID=3040295 RepID=UPI002550E460|nr:hypothetical protein [Mycolicibacterium sp. lyk4-40-TYG-92]